MKAIRPRETRLPMDIVRDEIMKNSYVMKVVNRVDNGGFDAIRYEVKTFDIDFASHFFYWNDTTHTGFKLLMVPFALNGDE